MTELEMKTEAEVEDFTDELSDEALDRAEGGSFSCVTITGERHDAQLCSPDSFR